MYQVTLINEDIETVIHSPYFNELKLKSGQIKQSINVADGFTFNIIPNNPGYNLIRPLKTLVTVRNTKTNELEFDGRVLMPTESMGDSGALDKTFLCESSLAFLNDSAQRHGEYHDITVRDFLQVIIDNHNHDIAYDSIDKSFRLGIVDVDSNTGTLYRYLGYESTFEAMKDKLIDRLGGEFQVRKVNNIRYLDYLQKIGESKTTEIRLAKNLKSITKEIDPTEIVTRLIPLGERLESEDEDATDASQARLTIESVNNGLDYIDDVQAMSVFGIITKSESWDDITQPNILKTRGTQFLQENNRVKSKHQISALDLSIIGLDIDSFDIGNSYPIINPIMGIDESLRVIEKNIDILNPNENSLVFGDKFKTASQYQQESNKARKNIINLENTVARQNNKISSISADLKNAKNELEVTKQQLEDFENINNQDIITITNSIDAILESIDQLEVLINNLEGVVNEQEIQQMKDDILTNKDNITTLTDELSSLTTRVDDLEGSDNND